MAEKVNIASLTIDINDVEKNSVELKKQLDSLKKAQKELDTSTEEGAAAYEALAGKIKNTSKAYKDNQNFAAALDAANQDLNKTMQVQGKSTQELYDSRRQLNQIAKNIQGNTEEEIQLRNDLNEAIDQQTQALRDQQSQFNSSKDKIGEYTQGINASDLSIQSLIKNSEEAGGATKLLSGGLKSATKSMGGLIKSTLKFLATPVGLILAAIAAAFFLIKNAMDRSEESTNKIKKGLAGFAGAAKGLLKLLQPLGDFLIDGLVKGFELVEKAIDKTFKFLQKALRRLGFDEAANKLEIFTEKIQEAAETSKLLTDAELAYAKAQRESRKVQLDYQKDAEKLRQIRDDEKRSIEERIKANDELGKVLDKQLNEELKLAQKALDLANYRIELEGETKDALDERAAAETEIADIQERITGQTSEQLTNRVALEKEAADEIKEIQDKIVEDRTKRATYELNEFIRNNKSKLDNEKFFSEQSLLQEEERLNSIAEKRREFEAKQLADGVITQTEYNDAINEINAQNDAEIEALRKEQSQAELTRLAIDADNKLKLLEETAANQFEILQARLNKEREAEILAAEKTGADVALINKKYAEYEKKINDDLNKAKLQSSAELFGNLATLFGENTKLGKAAGIAQATINTYLGISEVWKSPSILPEPFNTAAKVASSAVTLASGLATVQNIRNTDTQFSKGDILKGRSHSRGGIPFSIGGMLGFEAEGGEALINKKSTAMFTPLLSAINEAGGGKRLFESGDILGGSSTLSRSTLIDYDLLAMRISEANKNLPAPKVSVQEINDVNSNIKVIENLANS